LHVFRPASRWLVVHRRRSFPRSVVASLSSQSWQFFGESVAQASCSSCANIVARACRVATV